jgi:LacI family transcriptional regulator
MIGSPGFNHPESPFYVSLMTAVHEALEADQLHMLYLGSKDAWDGGVASKVDGVLFCGKDEAESVPRKLPAHLPRVAMLTNVSAMTSVGVDNYQGAQIAVQHLLGFGHHRIACLMERTPWEARRRLAGYSDALQEAGIEADPSWKRAVEAIAEQPGNDQSYLEWAREHMLAWLQSGWRETGCTAILAQNDMAAIGVLQALQKEGISVPGEVSVMGFDGTAICDLVSPRLSAVALPLSQIGARAVEILTRQIAGEASSPETILLPWSLRVGESVAPPP